jgi:hypothetical protein
MDFFSNGKFLFSAFALLVFSKRRIAIVSRMRNSLCECYLEAPVVMMFVFGTVELNVGCDSEWCLKVFKNWSSYRDDLCTGLLFPLSTFALHNYYRVPLYKLQISTTAISVMVLVVLEAGIMSLDALGWRRTTLRSVVSGFFFFVAVGLNGECELRSTLWIRCRMCPHDG